MGASFDEEQFPPDISQGAVGGMRFSTTITALSSGSEHRNINWANSRGKWDVKHGLKTQRQIEALIDFFAARMGRAYGFRFKDWLDYRVPRWEYVVGDMYPIPVMFTTDGVTRSFQVFKSYAWGSGGRVYNRPITKPIPSTSHLMVNGLEIISGPTTWECDSTNGVVSLHDAAIYGASGLQIGFATEFDVPVRFDVDEMQATITTTEIYSWDSIPVVEVREIS